MTTLKHNSFTSGPVSGKLTDAIPGIGFQAKRALEARGIIMAEELVGLFLYKKRDRAFMVRFFHEDIGCNTYHATMAVNAIATWALNFI